MPALVIENVAEVDMDKIFEKAIDALWLKWLSLPIVWCTLIVSSIGYAPTQPDAITWKEICIWIVFFVTVLIYTLATVKHNLLPRAKECISAVLFIIDAESDQYFQDVKNKLVSEFEGCTFSGNIRHFSAICIMKNRLSKYDLNSKEDLISLLYRVNCMFAVSVKHRVDAVDNAEHIEMQIQYAVLHPEFEGNMQELLQSDMNTLSVPVCRRRFVKTETIEQMAYTAKTLRIICQYVIGLVLLLAGCHGEGYEWFKKLYGQYKAESPEEIFKGFNLVLKNRLYVSCLALVSDDQDAFFLDKNVSALDDMNIRLEEANDLFPGTYAYYEAKAYYSIARNSDVATAKACIKHCKMFKHHNSWKYSEAFIAAFEGRAPMTVYSKYNQAFKHPHPLNRIVDYIEYMIEKEPSRITLHLAAGLVYHEFGEDALSKEHFDKYFEICNDHRIKRVLIDKNIWSHSEVA